MDQLIHGEVPYRVLQLSGRLKLHFMLTINGSHAQKSFLSHFVTLVV